MNKSLLSDQCHRVIFLIQRQDLTDSSSDYVLLTKCHKMLQLYCKEENSSRALSCLKVFFFSQHLHSIELIYKVEIVFNNISIHNLY